MQYVFLWHYIVLQTHNALIKKYRGRGKEFMHTLRGVTPTTCSLGWYFCSRVEGAGESAQAHVGMVGDKFGSLLALLGVCAFACVHACMCRSHMNS